MFILRQKLGCVLLVTALALPCVAQTNTPKPALKTGTRATSHKVRTGISGKKSAAKPAPEPPPVVQQEAPPPPPKRPFEESPVPPQVTYQGGQLTIMAPNSTLADILSAVRARTGTKIEYPSNASQERVALQLGPGSPRAVLTQLLQGSPFDYILLGSEQDPSAVTQVMLMRRESGTKTAAASGNIPNQAPSQPEPSEGEDADNEAAQEQAAQPQPAQPQPLARPTPGQVVPGQPQQIGQPGAMQQAPEQNATGTQTATPGQPGQPGAQDNGPKTPEQLLQQLQQMQRDQQQRQRPPR